MALMSYQMRALGCDPARIKGMSERLIVSHYENNHGGAVKRKHEKLIAMNPMILDWGNKANRGQFFTNPCAGFWLL
jgi:hypothetical protein